MITISAIKVKVQRKPILKLKVLPKFPVEVIANTFLTITRNGATYTFDVDYTKLAGGVVTDPATAMVAVLDETSDDYKLVSLASLLTSGLDLDLQAIAALTGTGILTRTGTNTWAVRTITGTANEITVTNGNGVAGAPTLSLPAALNFSGKTITGGAYTGAASFAGGSLSLNSGTTSYTTASLQAPSSSYGASVILYDQTS